MKGEEPLVAALQELRDSTMPDSQRLQGLLHLASELAKLVYIEKRRHEMTPERIYKPKA